MALQRLHYESFLKWNVSVITQKGSEKEQPNSQFKWMKQIFVVGEMILIPHFVVKQLSNIMWNLRKGNTHK